MSFVCYSVFESQLGCEVNNASTLEKALDAFTKSSMAGEVQWLIAVQPGIPRAQTISKLKSKVNSSVVPTNTSARNVNRRSLPPRRLPPRSSSRAMNVQRLKQVETRNMVLLLGNQMA